MGEMPNNVVALQAIMSSVQSHALVPVPVPVRMNMSASAPAT